MKKWLITILAAVFAIAAPGFPENAIERVQAAMNFVRERMGWEERFRRSRRKRGDSNSEILRGAQDLGCGLPLLHSVTRKPTRRGSGFAHARNFVARFPEVSTGKSERPQLLHKRVRVFRCWAQQSAAEWVAAKNVVPESAE
jgi:hypothetical protein